MRRRKPYSLLLRLSIWYAFGVFALVAIATVFLYWSLVKTLESRDTRLLSDRMQTVRMLLSAGADGEALRERVEHEWTAKRFERLYVRVVAPEGATITESPVMPAPVTSIFSAISRRDPTNVLRTVSDKAEGAVFRTFTARIEPSRPGRPPYFVALVLDRSHEGSMLGIYRQQMFGVLGIAALLAIFIGYRLAAHAVRPIHAMADTAARIRSSNLRERMPRSELPAELGLLAGTFNGMMDRLEDAFARLSRFSADLAHELRTPLTNIAGEMQVALGRSRDESFYRDTLGSALEELQRLSHVIDSLLFLARADDPGRALRRERVLVKKEIESVLDFYEGAASEAGLRYDLHIPDSLELDVERTLFHRAIGNVIANSIKYSRAAGSLQITARPKESLVELEITDSGCGIDEEHLPRLFDRFYRVDQSRSQASGGSGLGLAIVKSIVSIHGGEVELRSRAGRGTSVFLRFPFLTTSP